MIVDKEKDFFGSFPRTLKYLKFKIGEDYHIFLCRYHLNEPKLHLVIYFKKNEKFGWFSVWFKVQILKNVIR